MSRKPKYYQIYVDLSERIESNYFPQGSFLPTEKELQDNYNVSRITIREAVKMLETDGYIKKIPGVGILVVHSKKILDSSSLHSFSEEHQYREVESILTNFELVSPPDSVLYKLGIGKNDRVYCHDKIRIVDGVKIGYQRVFVPEKYIILKKEDLCESDQSLYKLFEDRGLKISHAHDSIEAIKASKSIANKLDVSVGEPLLYIERLTFDSCSRVIEYAQIFYVANKYRYQVKMNR